MYNAKIFVFHNNIATVSFCRSAMSAESCFKDTQSNIIHRLTIIPEIYFGCCCIFVHSLILTQRHCFCWNAGKVYYRGDYCCIVFCDHMRSFVIGLPLDTSEEEFTEMMSKYGIIMQDPDTSKEKTLL